MKPLENKLEHIYFKGFRITRICAGNSIFEFYRESDPEVCGWALSLKNAQDMINEILSEELDWQSTVEAYSGA